MIFFPYKKKNPSQPRSMGVCILGWTVIVSNIAMYCVYYFDLLKSSSLFLQRTVSLVAMIAVFPYDLFTIYFYDQWLPQTVWAMMVVICAFGILLLNKFARAVFIILNSLHIVVLGYIVVSYFGRMEFFDYFFKMYFTAVASGTYLAFLTLYEVRRQFQVDLEGLKLDIFLRKPLGKTVHKADSGKYADLSTAYLRLERYDEAVDALKKAIQGDPEKADYYFRLGLVCLKQHAFSEAIRYFKEAVGKDPLHYEAYYNTGILYIQQGSCREAAEMFLKAVHVRPQEAQTYRDLGDAYFSLGNFEGAVEQFQKAISLSRGDVYSYYRIGCILTEYLEQHQEAMEALRTAVRIKKGFCDAHFQLGKVCIKLKRYKEAVRALKEVIQLEQDHVQGHYYLGFCYVMLKDYDSARRQCGFLKKHDEDLADNLQILLTV